MKIVIITLIFSVVFLQAKKVSYRGCKVYSIKPSNKTHLEHIRKLKLSSKKFQFWSPICEKARFIDVMAPVQQQVILEKFLREAEIPFKVKIDDLEDIVEKESYPTKPSDTNFTHNKFYRYDEIKDYMSDVERKVDFAKIEIYGDSAEGRPLMAIKFSKGNTKRVILIDGGTHAREWVSVSMCLYLINQLAENGKYAFLTESADWIIVPVVNPDGYEYTHSKDRLWRKSRSENPVDGCPGTDLNRNWDFRWGEEGSSDDVCSEVYRGSKPFSEPETAGLASLASKHAPNIKLYVSFHSYGQYILYSWAYTKEPPVDSVRAQSAAQTAAEAIKKVRGSDYIVGESAGTMYPASGCSDDYMKAKLGVDMCYTVELSGGSQAGFIVAVDEIRVITSEMLEGLVELFKFAL